ncbi:MAG: WG repeat-containing protein [Tannerella sp.]|nr:WG repeat-containing protein [Tannerella sp.]
MKILNCFLSISVGLALISCGGGGSGVSELIPLFDGETCLYFNAKGEIAVRPETNVTETSLFRDGLALVKVSVDGKERTGFLDMKGKLAIEPKYLSATTFSEGLAWVVEPDGAPKAINQKGEEVISLPDVEEVAMFSEGLALFSIKGPDGNPRCGYVNKKGEIVIEPSYRMSQSFINGLAAAVTNDKWGYINTKGETVIPEQFATAGVFSVKGYAQAGTSPEHNGVIDKKGVYIINPKYEEVNIFEDDFIVKENDKYGLMDKDGKTVIPSDFKVLLPFYGNSYTMASMDETTFGIIDRKGKFTVNPQFQVGCFFIGGMSAVASGDKFGIINTKGKYLVNPAYEGFSHDLLMACKPVSHYHSVRSDYIDLDAIVAAVAGKGGREEYLEFSAASTYSDVKARYGKLSSSVFGRYHTSYDNVNLSGDAYIHSSVFTFKGPVSNPHYNTRTSKITETELNPSVKTAEYEIRFRNSRAEKKVDRIVYAVSEALYKRFREGEASVNVSKSSSSRIKIKVTY